MRTLPDADPGIPDDRSPGRYLWWVVRRHRVTVAVAMSWGMLWMLAQAMIPAGVGRTIDAAARLDGSGVAAWSAVVFGLGALQAFAGIARHRTTVFNYLSSFSLTLQVVIRRAAGLGSALSRRIDTGEVVAIGTADIRQVGAAIDILARGSGSLVGVIAVTVVLLTTSPELGLVVLLGVPILMATVGLLIRPMHRRQQAYRDQQGLLTGRAADLVGGLRVLRGIGGEDVMAARYRSESQRLRAAGVRTAGVESLLEAAQVLLPGIFLVLVTWLGARLTLTGQLTVGQLVSFYAYAAFLVSPLRQLTELIDKLTRGHVASRRITGLLRMDTDLPDPPRPASWPGRADLTDPRSGVVVRAGAFTALVATVPAEAAEIADRLGRFADGGTADGIPLRDLPLTTVRERILVADNDDRLFAGRLRDDLDPDDSGRLADALHTAAATDIVDALPDGPDSEVAERGRTFSGGQQQRLRLVRAVAADPETLILVEPTSAVDAHTEARIADRLAVARAGRTTVVCTSSPLVLDRAERVLLIDDGRVVAEGTHRELLAGEPRYARTVLREDS